MCGAVSFAVDGPMSQPVACHCVQCRKGSGHFNVSTNVRRADVTISGAPAWYAYKPGVRRGFCPVCGSQMFWEREGEDMISIDMGAFDDPTGVRIAGHIYTAEKGDYYEIADGLPTAPLGREGEVP